jgi:H/ACA ribonucleoprotein complex subunit 4
VSLSTGIKMGDLVAVKTIKGEAVAIGKSSDTTEKIVKAGSGIVAVVERVLMERSRYPPMWKKRQPGE